MEWTNDLSVGVQQIDDQHKELIKRANAFLTSMTNNASNAEVLSILDFLGAYVKTHFQDEENLQRRYGYPEFAEHKKIHDDFMVTVGKIRGDIAEFGFTPVTSSLVSSTLTNWLMLHIGRKDKAVGEYIRKTAR